MVGPWPGITGPLYPACGMGCPWLKPDIGKGGWAFGGISPGPVCDGTFGGAWGAIILWAGPLEMTWGG